MASTFSVQGYNLKHDPRSELFGFNLIAWDGPALKDPKVWQRSIASLRQVGVRRVTIVPYRLLDPGTLRLLDESKYGLVSGPSTDIVRQIVHVARSNEMSVSVKPMIEIDNPSGEGDIWRGTLRIRADRAEAFFASYAQHIRTMLRLAIDEGANRFYIGSELAGLVTDHTLRRYWTDLIAMCRGELGMSPCRLTYAANYDEYKLVPFWPLLDEIGIDAYFPLSRPEEAHGAGRPAVGLLKQRFAKVLSDLEALSRLHRREVMLAEWGVVPFDLTTTAPSEFEPSNIADAQEALNAYRAVIETVREQDDWLAGVDFWHWSVSARNDSHYSINAEHPVIGMLRTHGVL
jgi:hypothetical protein